MSQLLVLRQGCPTKRQLKVLALIVVTLFLAPLACDGENRTQASSPDTATNVRDVSSFGPFSMSGGPLAVVADGFEWPSLEDVLNNGWFGIGAIPTDIVFRGAAHSCSVRCDWRGAAWTPEQREQAIRFWLGKEEDEPLGSPAEVEAEFMS